MIRRQSYIFTVLLGFLLVFIVVSPIGANSLVDKGISTVQTKTDEIPIEFSHSEDFLITIAENQVEATDFNESEFLEALDKFNQTGVNVYNGSDTIPGSTAVIPGSGSLSYLVVNITESYIVDDNEPITDIDGGEIYFKIWVNGNYTRYPQVGEITSVNDGTTIPLDVIGFQGWTWNNTVKVEVWESDTTSDDYLGKAVYSTGNPQDETVTVPTDVGDATVTIQYNVTNTKTTFTAEELLWGYQPYLYIDDETSGTEEPDSIHGRVCIGNDPVISKTLWVLQYFFYWDIETYGTSPFEVQLHQYDYEELLIFLDPTNIFKPVRIAFDQARNAAYPDHEFVIYELNPSSTGTFSQNIFFSDDLQPFLGTNLTIDYRVEDLDLLSADWIASQFGGQTFNMTIDTFYHAFDNGKGSNEIAFDYYVQELNNSLLKDWYSHLNESLHGTIHNIPVISYTTPEISPFTFDVSNPFQRPYIINAWANVMDDLEVFTKAQSQDITMTAEMNVTITAAVEALLTIQYQETVSPGTTYDLNYQIDIYDDTVTLKTDYDLDLNLSGNFWFLGGEFLLIQTGSFEVDIPLATINGLLDKIGISPQSVVDRIVDKINDYLTTYYFEIEYLTVSPQLLGTVLNTSVRLHLWDIVKDFIPVMVSSVAPQFYPVVNAVITILDRIISHIDLQAIFLVQTMITGDLAVSDTNQAQLTKSAIEFNESSVQVPVKLTIADTPTNPNLRVSLSSLANGINFFIDWYFDAGLEPPFSYFIDDFSIYIGRYPSYEMNLPNGWITANISTVSIDMTITGVSTSQPTSATTTSEPGNGFLMIETIAVVAFILYIRRRRMKKSE
ncbi:MAG: hypothetical protein ACFE9L_16620 [Candidatus Hodarchaeota archaeon]